MCNRGDLLSSLQRLHEVAWNKGDHDTGVFVQHRVSRDPAGNRADVNMDDQRTVTTLRWSTSHDGWKRLLANYDANAILVRDEYNQVLLEIIKHASRKHETMVIDASPRAQVQNPFRQELPEFETLGTSVTGVPGIGKSAFLIFVLALRLLAGKPSVFQGSHDYGFVLDESGVQEVPARTFTDEALSAGTWFLIDSNEALHSVSHTVMGAARISRGFIIQSASMRNDLFAWFDKIGMRRPQKIYMAPWTIGELIAGRELQLDDPHLTEREIVAFCEKFGTSARAVYGNGRDPLSYEKCVREKIALLNFGVFKELVRIPVRDIESERYFPHLFLFSTPVPNNRTRCITGIPTRHLTMLVHEHLCKVQQVATEDMYHYFVANSSTVASAGYLLEQLFLECFPSGGEWPVKVMEKEYDPETGNVHWRYDDSPTIQYLRLGWQGKLLDIRNVSVGGTPSDTFQALRQINFVENEQLNLDPAFYVPRSKASDSFDAFAISNTADDLVATVFQITVKRKHRIKEEGLIWLKDLGAQFIDLVVVTCPIKEGLGGCDNIEVEKEHADRLRNVYRLELT